MVQIYLEFEPADVGTREATNAARKTDSLTATNNVQLYHINVAISLSDLLLTIFQKESIQTNLYLFATKWHIQLCNPVVTHS